MTADSHPNLHLKRIFSLEEARAELAKVGCDPESVGMMAPKMRHYVFKIKDLDCRAANVLKQEMLSKDGEAAVAWWSSGFTRPTTDVMAIGTLKQFKRVLANLRIQPHGLKAVGAELERALKNVETDSWPPLTCGPHELPIGERTLVMGVLNVTPDSFSEEGRHFDRERALDRGIEMVAEGADVIDVGGESTRPGAEPVPGDVEIERVVPVIRGLVDKVPVPISIDTRKAAVAEAALEAGATMVNDVTALRGDPPIALVAAKFDVPVVLMHMRGEPRTMQAAPVYEDLMAEIIVFLRDAMMDAVAAGIAEDNLLVDPGFGFGKTVHHNLEMLRRLDELKSLGRPIVLGTSRKSTIGQVLDLPVDQRVEGTAATVAVGIMNGASMVRVHDVAAMARVAKMTDAIKKGEAWRG